MRSPKYLDVTLLSSMADYYNIPVPHTGQITHKTVDSTDSGLGVDKVAKAHRDRTATQEVVETYQSEIRPVKLFNNVVDELLASDEVCDLTHDPNAVVIHRKPVLAEGELELAAASEVGDVIGKFMPMFLQMIEQGRTEFEATPSELMQQFFGGAHLISPPVMHMDVDGCDYKIYMVLGNENFINATTDDLVGDLTVFGLAERIIREGSSYSLEKYLTPGLNRATRRMMGADGLRGMIDGAAQSLGREIDVDDMQIQGPAILLNVAGIFA